MKKLLWPLCVIAVLLSAAVGGFALAYLTEEQSYDQIKGADIAPPAQAARSIGILHEGDFPGMSDVPVTAQQAAPGRATLNALREQSYTRAFPFLRPDKGGIAVRDINGCTPWYIAYWDGNHLWLPGEAEGQWQGYIPSNPDKLGETLESIHNE